MQAKLSIVQATRLLREQSLYMSQYQQTFIGLTSSILYQTFRQKFATENVSSIVLNKV